MSQQPNRPEIVFARELNGVRVEAPVWRNEYERDGRTFYRYSVTTNKQYYDWDTKTWQDSKSFFPADLPLLIAVATEAHNYVTSPERRKSMAPEEMAEVAE
ncbi:MAG: hypothetical protein GXY44_03720 [Phycisphaerales bacterium]|nr:hypothetical protein [Phycisphaerales bacterium]